MVDSIDTTNVYEKPVVDKCKTDLKKYFHPRDLTLKQRFDVIYKITKLNDSKVASKVGIDRTTMNRFRNGIFFPTAELKLLIAQAITELSGIQIDSVIIWGDSIYLEKWRNKIEVKDGIKKI